MTTSSITRKMLSSIIRSLLIVGIPAMAVISTLPVAHAGDSAEYEKIQTTLSSVNQDFLILILATDPDKISKSLNTIRSDWSSSYLPMALEAFTYTNSNRVRIELNDILLETRGEGDVVDINDYYRWIWNKKFEPNAGYGNFKADLYRLIDPKFDTYFRDRQQTARIRLDEIRWGGVRQDGIPPLRNPEMITAKQAKYLEDDHIVFGIEINGDARAYPKRILAWHEMFTDTIGGVPIAGVYCTLCGTVIPYRTQVNGVDYSLGTSGFLYRSNKLMYDKATQSLWSTQRGEPVLGPLADKGIALPFESIVTTTWGAWRQRHPDTTVLSLNTGHRRDYDEGAAYANYFGTDELMFNTPFQDDRLANKQEVLALRFAAAPNEQLAIDTDFLSKNPLYKNRIGRQHFVVLTDESGANRVYDPESIQFVDYDGDLNAIDDNITAVIIEPIQGEGGVIPADKDFLSKLRKKCDENGAAQGKRCQRQGQPPPAAEGITQGKQNRP